ncbi:Phm7 protein [Martiniozyma asiatica (nom. inval.)]|nr:Phm7 protein [Martiniozyma asiatica]
MADTSTGSSTSAFVTTLIFNLIIFTIFVLVFVSLRNKYINVYRPRTISKTLPGHLVPEAPSKSPFNWFFELIKKQDSFIVQHVGVDGYFFLRYLRTFAIVGCLGGVVLWPILFAVNATGGGNQTGFNIISYANNAHRWRTFAHLFCSWYFFGIVLYTIYSELVFYTSFRHNMQCTPFYQSLPSSKVLLIDNVSEDLLDEDSLRKFFPAANSIRITRDTSELRTTWEKRNKLINKLEGGFVSVLSKCLKTRFKAEKKNKEIPQPENEFVSYIKDKKLPTYKLKPIIGEKKRVFDEGFEQLAEFNKEIEADQEKYPDNFEKKLGSVFLEFPSHLEQQRAYQAVDTCKEFSQSRRFNSFMPEEVIWKNVGVGYIVRKGKKTGANTFLTLMIIFWAIPVAVVGCISNINYLTEKVHFLRFIDNMPNFLMGIITGVLPTVALSILMSLVPPVIMWWGKFGGAITVQQLDFYVQQWYFAFQVIQVFLVTTCTSAASSVVTSIINDPDSAMLLLAENLPPASNFYICYMLLQGLSISSGMLAQVVGLILSFILGRLLDKTPRQLWNRRVSLATPAWGVTYSGFGMFTVILLCYAIISPIIIAFTVISYALIYIAKLYSLVYVSGHGVDNRGRNYPLALFEVFVGLYLGEVCLIGLFVMQKNWAIVVLEAIALAITVGCHLYFRWLFEPVLDTVPLSIMSMSGEYPTDFGRADIKNESAAYFAESKEKSVAEVSTDANAHDDDVGKQDQQSSAHFSVPETFDNGESTPKMDVKSRLVQFLKPVQFTSFKYARPYMPQFWFLPSNPFVDSTKFETPEVTDGKPILWIPQDNLGLSKKIQDLCAKNDIAYSTKDAIIAGKGKVEITEEAMPPNYEPEFVY